VKTEDHYYVHVPKHKQVRFFFFWVGWGGGGGGGGERRVFTKLLNNRKRCRGLKSSLPKLVPVSLDVPSALEIETVSE
jgi:hypothetical protein